MPFGGGGELRGGPENSFVVGTLVLLPVPDQLFRALGMGGGVRGGP